MLRKLDPVVLRVRDWPAAVRWYTETLGLKIVYKEDHDQWCQLSFPEGGARLALFSAEVSPGSRNRCLPDILVEDLSKTVEELKRREVEFRGEIRGGDEGYRIATMVDPEGNELQLYEWVTRG